MVHHLLPSFVQAAFEPATKQHVAIANTCNTSVFLWTLRHIHWQQSTSHICRCVHRCFMITHSHSAITHNHLLRSIYLRLYYVPFIWNPKSKTQSNLSFFCISQDGSFQVVGELNTKICQRPTCFQVASPTIPIKWMRDDEQSIFWCMLMLDDLWQLLVFVFVSFCGCNQFVNQCSRWHRGFTCRTTPRQSRSSCLYEPWILIICLSWLGIYIESKQILYNHAYIIYWYTSRNSPLSHLQFHIYTFKMLAKRHGHRSSFKWCNQAPQAPKTEEGKQNQTIEGVGQFLISTCFGILGFKDSKACQRLNLTSHRTWILKVIWFVV